MRAASAGRYGQAGLGNVRKMTRFFAQTSSLLQPATMGLAEPALWPFVGLFPRFDSAALAVRELQFIRAAVGAMRPVMTGF